MEVANLIHFALNCIIAWAFIGLGFLVIVYLIIRISQIKW